MGYKPGKKLYHLQFADFEGLTVDAHGTSIGKLMHLSTLNPNLNEPDPAKRLEIFEFFAEVLVSWNVEHPSTSETDGAFACPSCGLFEDEPMPCTVQSLMCLELDFIMRIVIGWMSAVANVSLPKGPSLSDGGTNIEQALMRLAQHQNLSTLPTPNLS